jgi:hypothetical protein
VTEPPSLSKIRSLKSATSYRNLHLSDERNKTAENPNVIRQPPRTAATIKASVCGWSNDGHKMSPFTGADGRQSAIIPTDRLWGQLVSVVGELGEVRRTEAIPCCCRRDAMPGDRLGSGKLLQSMNEQRTVPMSLPLVGDCFSHGRGRV